MISRDNKCIFIHIPKSAGTSIERIFGVHPFQWKEKNLNSLVGWDDINKIHLQHASLQELIDFNLIDRNCINSYFIFTIVRNPFDRAVSDYFYLCKQWKIQDSFENYILERNRFALLFDRSRGMFWRGDHTRTQRSFITIDGEVAVDKVLRFEEIGESLYKLLREKFPDLLKENQLPHEKKSLSRKHYSHYINKRNRYLIEKKYTEDLDTFGYKFENITKYFVFDFFKLS